ncbi:EthD family reductase [Mycolicibacterium goodii]|uniref:EthD family reductase n=1 Tax=Mycolicibacterium goodii TaxID=134601 RepID=UPI000C264A74|nr:EthD family reductase [Mycolicibacterium goodii]PJK18853.1 ethD like-protein [Mycolicibacterium goodii]
MHDVIVLYNHPRDPEAFDAHYRDVHVPLVHKLPLLKEFTYGHVDRDNHDSGYYLMARLTYASAADCAESMASDAGKASVDDLGNFAAAGVTLLNVARTN